MLWRQSQPRRQEFETFYRSTVRPLASHLRQLGLRDPTQLDDVLQSTYIEAHKCWGSLKEAEKATSWVFTIGRRQFFKWLKANKKEWEHRIDQEVDETQAHQPTVDLDQKSLVGQVVHALNSIKDPVKKESITLFYLEEWSLKEIAIATNTKVSTLTTWMNRFRNDLKQKIPQDPLARPKASDEHQRGRKT